VNESRPFGRVTLPLDVAYVTSRLGHSQGDIGALRQPPPPKPSWESSGGLRRGRAGACGQETPARRRLVRGFGHAPKQPLSATGRRRSHRPHPISSTAKSSTNLLRGGNVAGRRVGRAAVRGTPARTRHRDVDAQDRLCPGAEAIDGRVNERAFLIAKTGPSDESRHEVPRLPTTGEAGRCRATFAKVRLVIAAVGRPGRAARIRRGERTAARTNVESGQPRRAQSSPVGPTRPVEQGPNGRW